MFIWIRKSLIAIEEWFSPKIPYPCDCSPTINREISNKQLLVDVSIIYKSDARTGIQRVVRSLFLKLIETPLPGYEIRPVFATRRKSYSYALQGFLERPILSDHPTLPVKVGASDIFLGLDLAANLLPRHREQLRCWKRHGASIHVVIYDLLPLLHKQWFNRRMVKHFRRWLRFVLRDADSALCISNQVSSDLHRVADKSKYLRPGNPLRISKIRLSGDISASAPTIGLPSNMESLSKYFAEVHMVLMVGTIEPRKAYDKALAAFDRLWKTSSNKDYVLVIVGKPGWKTNKLQNDFMRHPEWDSRLFWFNDATDEFVEKLYELAAGVLITSHAEGYGLPLAEAGVHAKPVLARDLPVFREFSQPNISFFSDDNPIPLAQVIDRWRSEHRSTANMEGIVLPDWSDSLMDVLRAIDIKPQIRSTQVPAP